MRAGCTGCLVWVVLIVGTGLFLTGTAVLGIRMLTPPVVDEPETSPADGSRAQRKIVQLARRDRPGDPVTLTEGEVNALLGRHVVEAGGTRLSRISARLRADDRVQIRARTTAGRLLDEIGLRATAAMLPSRWNERPVHLRIDGRVSTTDIAPRQLRLEIEGFALGQQSLPAPILRLLVDPATVGLLQWRLPDHVEKVSIEPGRVVVRTAP